MTTRKLVRSRDHRVIAGVCGGIAEYFDIDPTIVRVVTAALGLFSLGAVCAAYVIAWLAIPDQGSGQTGADHLHLLLHQKAQRRIRGRALGLTQKPRGRPLPRPRH